MKKLTSMLVLVSCFNLAIAERITNCIKEGAHHPKDLHKVIATADNGNDPYLTIKCMFQAPDRVDIYRGLPVNMAYPFAWEHLGGKWFACQPYDEDGDYEPKVCSFVVEK